MYKLFCAIFLFFTNVCVAQIQQEDIDTCIASAGCAVFRVSWTAPEARENGTSIKTEDIGKYEISYNLEGDEAKQIVMVDGGLTTTLIPGFIPGETYLFQVVAIDIDGLYGKRPAEQVSAMAEPSNSRIVPIELLNLEPWGILPANPLENIIAWCERTPNCTMGISLTVE